MPTAYLGHILLEYEEFGEADHPCVLLIMGLGAQLTAWPVSFCMGLAQNGFRVVRFDNRDAGKSTHLTELGMPDPMSVKAQAESGEAPILPYTLEDMAKDAIGLIEFLSVETAHIVGASMGGMIAQLVAAQHPDRTKSLVSIMSTSGKRGLPEAAPDFMAAFLSPPQNFSREGLVEHGLRVRKLLESPAFAATEDELTKAVEAAVDRVPFEPTGSVRQLAAVFGAEPRDRLLGQVAVPTLVVHGADDPLIPIACGKDTAACIPGAQFVGIDGMAHDLTAALVPVILEHINGFLRKVENARSS